LRLTTFSRRPKHQHRPGRLEIRQPARYPVFSLSSPSLPCGTTVYLLSYYFLLTTLSQARRRDYVQKFELLLHLSSMWFPITATMGIFDGWYDEQELGGGCYITDGMIEWIESGIPYLFTNLSMIINYGLIYIVVQKALRSSSSNESSEQQQQQVVAAPAQKQIKKETATIMFLYVGYFFVTTTPTFVRMVSKSSIP